jgi:hypothetical protein
LQNVEDEPKISFWHRLLNDLAGDWTGTERPDAYTELSTLHQTSIQPAQSTESNAMAERPAQTRVFISYRRADEGFAAALLDGVLSQHFGEEAVFRDTRSIRLGQDFRSEVWRMLQRADVMLVIIGPNWLTASDSSGHRRIDQPNDFQRNEIAQGLRSGIRIIPVLLEDARIPAPTDLPNEIAELAQRQYVRLRARQANSDIETLVTLLQDLAGNTGERTGSDSRPVGEFKRVHDPLRQEPDASFEDLVSQLRADDIGDQFGAVYRLAVLADSYPDSRQRSIDALCAYLRSPPERVDDSLGTNNGDHELRLCIINIIRDHFRLDENDERSWRGFDLDLSGATLNGGDLSGAFFQRGRIRFDGATFVGGEFWFSGASFSGADVTFDEAAFVGGVVAFDRATFSGGRVSFKGAAFKGAQVRFDSAQFFGGTVTFESAAFTGGDIWFGDAFFSNGQVSFVDSAFKGTMIDMSRASTFTAPPTFTWTEQPAGLLLPVGTPADPNS